MFQYIPPTGSLFFPMLFSDARYRTIVWQAKNDTMVIKETAYKMSLLLAQLSFHKLTDLTTGMYCNLL